MGKVLSIFIDESGDVGFIKDASKYYIITFVMHNQNDDIKSNIEKIKDYPIFHAGPIIRREYPFDNMEMKDRKKIFQAIFMFTLSLPIKIFSFCYEKKDFNGDLLKMQAKITKDVYNFLLNNFDYLNSFNEIIIYYMFEDGLGIKFAWPIFINKKIKNYKKAKRYTIFLYNLPKFFNFRS